MKAVYSTEEHELFLRLNNLRGMLAFVVLFSHIWGYTGISFLVPFNKIVTIAVAFFFFLSGYGMMCSYSRKSDYIKEIVLVKIPYLLWMALAAYVFSAVFEILFGNTAYYLPFGLRQFFVSTNWYVWELTGFYFLFIICRKFVKERYQIVFACFISVLAFAALYYSGLVEAYYNSIIGFCLGMAYGSRKCREAIVKQKKGWMLGVFLLAAGFAGMMVMDKNGILFAAVRNAAAMGAILLALYLIRYIDTCDRINKYFSAISPEIYFYHIPVTMILSSVVQNKWLYVLITVGLTFLIAPVMNFFNRKVQKRLKMLYEKGR